MFLWFAWAGAGMAQIRIGNRAAPLAESALPDAPSPQQQAAPALQEKGKLADGVSPIAKKFAEVIEPGQTAQPLSGGEKLILSLRENIRPSTLLPALYSTGYEQLSGSDPKYGSDSGAGAVKFGAAMLRAASTRTLGVGVFAAVFHQDPRYYRIGDGSIVHRGLRSAEQAVVRRGDDGSKQFNFSGIAGRAAAAVLTLAYYPPASQNRRVVLSTFGTSIATDAGGNLVLEFLPDLAHKFPILKKIQID